MSQPLSPRERAEAIVLQRDIGRQDLRDLIQGHIEEAEREAARKAVEACMTAIVARCSVCGGSGGVSVTGSAHAGDCDGSCRNCPVPVEEQEQCEYCGRPVAALAAAFVPESWGAEP